MKLQINLGTGKWQIAANIELAGSDRKTIKIAVEMVKREKLV